MPRSQPYLLCNYLEKLNDNKKDVVYQRSKKKCFLYEESIVYPLVEFEPNYSKKEDLFFPSNNKFIEVLNCVQFCSNGFIILVTIVFHSLKNLFLAVVSNSQVFGMIYMISFIVFFFQIFPKFVQSSCLYLHLCSRFHLF